MAIDKTTLTKGQLRNLNVLRKSVGNNLGEEAFDKWLVSEAPSPSKLSADSVAEKIGDALGGVENGQTFRLGNYGYTIRRARGKGRSGFTVTKNKKPE